MNKIIHGIMIGTPFAMIAWVYQHISMSALTSAHFAIWPSVALAIASCVMANANKAIPNTVLILGSIGTSLWMVALISTPADSVRFGHFLGVVMIAIHYMFVAHISANRFHTFHADKLKKLADKSKANN